MFNSSWLIYYLILTYNVSIRTKVQSVLGSFSYITVNMQRLIHSQSFKVIVSTIMLNKILNTHILDY